MEPPPRPSTSLFDVYLRLRPTFAPNAERFLDVERLENSAPTHITIHPPSNDRRKRAIERFAFTEVFEEHADQLDLFQSIGLPSMIEGVIGQEGREGRDGTLATLGVTGSGKSHTILGSNSQRGLTQLSLDTLFQNLGPHITSLAQNDLTFQTLCAADGTEAQMLSAGAFMEIVYGDGMPSERGTLSRAPTPMRDLSILSMPTSNSRRYIPRVSALPQYPTIDDIEVQVDATAEYAVVVSMYEVYNDRIFDLLTGPATKLASQKQRRGLLFKSTEQCQDRKVVAGLRKVVCSNLDEALLVLETGLTERRVAGTGTNAVSSRSHGFFCLEVKKRRRGVILGPWTSSTLSIVDLAGSERARTAKTAGATLAEAGKINESLMYLGQCMQMQSDNSDMSKPQNVVPFRQCKLTELLFSNSVTASQHHHTRKSPQKSIMIVTADPLGDFNATSQILRYSALAREVTVPRIPSVTSTILASGIASSAAKISVTSTSGRSTPSAAQEELEQALAELAQLREQIELTQLQLDDEVQRRRDAETSWLAAEERIEQIEQDVRDEVWAEMEAKLGEEQRRWRVAREEEAGRSEVHLDAKLDILARGFDILEDPEPGDEQRIEELEDENQMLRERIKGMEREQGQRSPSKKMRVLKTRQWNGSGVGLDGSP